MMATDAELMDDLRSRGLDRWSTVRTTVRAMRKLAKNTHRVESEATLTHVLELMDNAETMEAAALAVKRAEANGDIDALRQALMRLASLRDERRKP
jgi:hypothetical protein